jgi:hypothetical protein
MTHDNTATYVVGVDPGPVAGVVELVVDHEAARLSAPVDVVQCCAPALPRVLDGLVRRAASLVVVATEGFVVSSRAARSSTPRAGKAARETLALVAGWVDERHIPYIRYVERGAAEVKPWATDTRLTAAGLLEPTKGMRHARDAARHALFTAVRECGLPDPPGARYRDAADGNARMAQPGAP